MQRATEMEKSSHKQWWLPGPNLCLVTSPWAVVRVLLITARGEQVLTPEQQCILRAEMTQHRGDGAEQCQEPAPQTELIELCGIVWDPGDLGQHDSSELQWYPQELTVETKLTCLEIIMLF